MPTQVENLVFPPDRTYAEQAAGEATLASEAATAALHALLQAIALGCVGGAPAQTGSAPPASLLAAGSGALIVQLRVLRATCVCLLDAGAVGALYRAPAPSLPALPPLAYAQALRAVPVRLPLSIGQAEVALGSLVTLAVGDVVRLESSVAQPLKVSGPNGTVWFEAHLGTLDASLAIEVAKRPQ